MLPNRVTEYLLVAGTYGVTLGLRSMWTGIYSRKSQNKSSDPIPIGMVGLLYFVFGSILFPVCLPADLMIKYVNYTTKE